MIPREESTMSHRLVARAPGGIRFVLVGRYQIVTDNARPKKLQIRDGQTGEAMETDVQALEYVVQKFFRDKF